MSIGDIAHAVLISMPVLVLPSYLLLPFPILPCLHYLAYTIYLLYSTLLYLHYLHYLPTYLPTPHLRYLPTYTAYLHTNLPTYSTLLYLTYQLTYLPPSLLDPAISTLLTSDRSRLLHVHTHLASFIHLFSTALSFPFLSFRSFDSVYPVRMLASD